MTGTPCPFMYSDERVCALVLTGDAERVRCAREHVWVAGESKLLSNPPGWRPDHSEWIEQQRSAPRLGQQEMAL